MRRTLFVRLALGGLGICAGGMLAGMSLADYAESGAFQFYREARAAEWEPDLPPQPAAIESTDLAFASDRRGERAGAEPEEEVASLYP